jgi:hypothetical protein
LIASFQLLADPPLRNLRLGHRIPHTYTREKPGPVPAIPFDMDGTTIPGSVNATRVHNIARDIADTLLQLDCDIMGCFIRIEASCYPDKATSPYTWVVTE